MREVRIVKRQVLDNDYIVFPVSYMNPLASIKRLEKELKNNIEVPCKILVDLLLCNGANFNRFVSLKFDGSQIDKQSIEIIELTSIEKNCVNQFYVENRKLIQEGVLIPSEYLQYVK